MKVVQTVLPSLIIGGSAFGLGYGSQVLESGDLAPVCLQEVYQETSIVEFQELVGDALQIKLNGPARLVWNDDFVEGDGVHAVPLGQLPSEYEQNFRDFPFVGHAGTLKFYPSDSYPARGTHPSVRRFFASREAAEVAGFVASKLVKDEN